MSALRALAECTVFQTMIVLHISTHSHGESRGGGIAWYGITLVLSPFCVSTLQLPITIRWNRYHICFQA